MKIYLLRITAVLPLLLLFPGNTACPDEVSKKPLSPLRITISPLDKTIDNAEIPPNAILDFIVVAGSSVDVTDAAVTVTTSGGAAIAGGTRTWSGAIRRDTTKELTISVRASNAGRGKITARIETSAGKSAVFRAAAQYVLGKQPEKKKVPEGRAFKDGQGRDAIEYEIK